MTQTIDLAKFKATTEHLGRALTSHMLWTVYAIALSSLLGWPGEAIAQRVSRSEPPPPIVWDHIGPGIDASAVPPARTRSAGVVVQVLTGDDQVSTDLAAWIEKNGVNRQTDGYGNAWVFDPERPNDGWRRTARVQLKADGPVEARELAAGLKLTNYLNYKATTAAVSLALPEANKDKSIPSASP